MQINKNIFYSKIRLISIIIIIILITLYCKEKEEYSDVPSIKYESLNILSVTKDTTSIQLKISFTDGDGDIGRESGDKTTDFYIKYFEKQNGKYNQVTIYNADSNRYDTINYNSIIPYLTPDGKNKNLKGDISIRMIVYNYALKQKDDTIAFKFYITDRANHKSNEIMSPDLIIHK
jgi:hypothetical protein